MPRCNFAFDGTSAQAVAKEIARRDKAKLNLYSKEILGG